MNLNDKGVCSLNFYGKINVDIIYNKENNQCIFASPIGRIPVNAEIKYFKQLLISNGFGTETGGAMIGIEKEENRIVLSYNFISNVFSFELFKTVLENFVSLVEEWQSRHKDICDLKSFAWTYELSKYFSY